MPSIYVVTDAPNLNNCTHLWYARKCEAKASIKIIRPEKLGLLKAAVANGEVSSIGFTDDRGWIAARRLLGREILAPSSVKYGDIIGCTDLIQVGKFDCRVTALPTRALLMAGRDAKVLNFIYMDRLMGQPGFYKPPPILHAHIKDEFSDDAECLRQLCRGEYMNHAGLTFKPSLISIDLETLQSITIPHPQIKGEVCTFGALIDVFGCSIGGWFEGEAQTLDNLTIFTFTLDFVRPWQHELCKLVSQSPYPKTFSNGMYDITYLMRWDLAPVNILWDSEYWLRAACPDLSGWYSLQSQSNMYMSVSPYWKDGRSATTRKEYHEYCGNDCHTTLAVSMVQLASATKPNLRNFIIGYSTVPYGMYSSLRGMEVDLDVRAALDAEYESKLAKLDADLREVFGCGAGQSAKLLPYFQAIESMHRMMGTKDVPKVDSTDSKIVNDLRTLDPITDLVLGWVKESRTTEKWLSTYIRCKLWGDTDNGVTESESDGRKFFVWGIQPFGTRTGRLSSQSSSLWVGGSAHTLPAAMRKMMKAPKDYVFITTDAPQSESRVTAYESRCERLRAAVESEQDFHALNASAFFGIPYDQIYSDELKKTINKVIRDLAKRTNHGANYNMGAFVLATTMGAAKVRFAQKALNLPEHWSIIQVCRHLLKVFADTYVEVKTTWPLELVTEVVKTGRVTCQVSGYRPVILGNPIEFKPDLNGLISTVPQSTSAYISIKSAKKLFWSWLRSDSFPLIPVVQIHDEVVSLTKDDTPVSLVDSLILDHCSNSYPMKWGEDTKIMSIPVGDVVAGRTWDKLKVDAKPREESKQLIGDYA